MFEFVTRRRLIVCLIPFLFITVFILFVFHSQSSVISRAVKAYYAVPLANVSLDEGEQDTNTCYLTEPIEIIELCQKCTPYERRSKAIVCSPTDYKELVMCQKSNIKISRSCPIPAHIQKQKFWIFEGIVLVISLLAIASVNSRQKTLDKQMVDKIRRQIGESDN